MNKKASYIILALPVVMILAVWTWNMNQVGGKTTTNTTLQSSTETSDVTTSTNDEATTIESSNTPVVPTQAEYPDLSQYTDLSITVSIARQEMTIFSEGNPIFSTVVSTGKNETPTPTGQFVIEAERGEFFYNASSGEGAYYWVSFKDQGIYLFHSVPTDQYGNELAEESSLLGSPSSHGCVRMPRETAKWFYESIPEGTPVAIE